MSTFSNGIKKIFGRTFATESIGTNKDTLTQDKILNALHENQDFWKKCVEKASKNDSAKRILIATSMSDYNHAASLDRLLAIALTAKGHKVAFLLCNSELEGCQIIKFQDSPTSELLNHPNTPRCFKCAPKIKEKFLPLGLPIYTFQNNDLVHESEMKSFQKIKTSEFRHIQVDEISIGEHAWAGAVRYFASSNLETQEYSREIILRFLKSALRVKYGTEKAINLFHPEIVIAHHGIYVPQGIITQVAKAKNIFTMTWTPSYRKGTFIFSPTDSYHYALVEEDSKIWRDYELDTNQKNSLRKYMKSRELGQEDWIKFSDSKIESRETHKSNSSYFLLLTSVTWDAELHYKSRAFTNMKNWLATTVDVFRDYPEQKLIIRIHPAEVTSPNKSRERMSDFLQNIGASELPNVEIIQPTSQLSTYSLIQSAKAVLIYNTKTGIEAAYMKKPVITSGEAWIKGKGLSTDAYSPEEYIEILRRAINGNLELTINFDLAEKYAYHFFFKRMIRFEIFSGETTKDLLPKTFLEWSQLTGEFDPNFNEVINAIIENRTPYSKVI